MGMVRIFTWNPVMTSIFEGLFTPKTRPFQTKTRVIRVSDTYMNTINYYGILNIPVSPMGIRHGYGCHSYFILGSFRKFQVVFAFYGHFKKKHQIRPFGIQGSFTPRKIQCSANGDAPLKTNKYLP